MKKIVLGLTLWIWFLGVGAYFFIPYLYTYKDYNYHFEVLLKAGPYIAVVIYLLSKLKKETSDATNGFAQYLSIQKKLLPHSRKELKHAEEKQIVPNKEKTNDSISIKIFSYSIGFLLLFLSATGWSLVVDLFFEREEVRYEGRVLERTKNNRPRRYFLRLSSSQDQDITLGVSPELFNETKVGDELVVTYRKGAFGFEKL